MERLGLLQDSDNVNDVSGLLAELYRVMVLSGYTTVAAAAAAAVAPVAAAAVAAAAVVVLLNRHSKLYIATYRLQWHGHGPWAWQTIRRQSFTIVIASVFEMILMA